MLNRANAVFDILIKLNIQNFENTTQKELTNLYTFKYAFDLKIYKLN